LQENRPKFVSESDGGVVVTQNSRKKRENKRFSISFHIFFFLKGTIVYSYGINFFFFLRVGHGPPQPSLMSATGKSLGSVKYVVKSSILAHVFGENLIGRRT
jgi:hypothetical protein